MRGRRVVITGVSTHFGTQLARRLRNDPDVEYLAGLDVRPPRERVDGLDFVEADLREPDVMSLLPETRADTLIHNNILRRPRPGMSAQAAHDINVIGSLQLLAGCERTPSLETIVIRGSAGIYGAEPSAPQFFTEEMSRLYPLKTRFQRDVGEIENYFATFCRRRGSIVCTMLRYQPAIGPSLDTQVTRYLDLPVAPTYLGFDPRLQFIHETDALGALVAAVKRPVDGPVNVAADGTIGLTRMIRMAGKPSLPIFSPFYGVAVAAGRRFGLGAFSPDFRRLLRYGRAIDTRRLTTEIGFRPRLSTVEAIRDYLGTRREGTPAPAGEPA